jgi:hypothetical protein
VLQTGVTVLIVVGAVIVGAVGVLTEVPELEGTANDGAVTVGILGNKGMALYALINRHLRHRIAADTAD